MYYAVYGSGRGRCRDFLVLDPVYTVPDPQGHDIKLNTFKTSVALKFIIILLNLTTTSHRKSGESKYDRKLTKLDVVTTRIRCRVNGVLKWGGGEGVLICKYLKYGI